ncbi:glucose 1-dehydrogenase [Paenibacillus sp. LMG 31456]|uniref:Glucose 1-dehydrogenase n=1 Tax=Paenibacillus foliorum TaxID=2654974 RepID=A0A972GSI7_9BACL|nr:SDR family oxidoreductase [Paenibacillus foliorum]NOU95533.1 glucose 1-dehydrogenase [Paenibacillus foliorum]
MNFDGKIALVTGGARGIGASIVKQFLENGAKVIIADVSPDGEQLMEQWRSQGKEVAYVHCDVSRENDVNNAVSVAEQQFGKLDIVVNNAGIFPRADLLQTDEAFWDRIMDINLKGVYLMCKAVVPVMIRQGGGCIVNMGSLHASIGGEELFAYAISKGGVVTLTRNLAHALAKHNIRVNGVHPGWVASHGERALMRAKGEDEDWPEQHSSVMPLGRLQTEDDIANSVVFLCSANAGQITGQMLTVDGGLGFSML